VRPSESAFEAFRNRYPAFDSTRKLDELRATEYARLDRQGHVYLDYTGGGLHAESQSARPGKNNLFAYPAQSNFTGVQHPLDWITQAQSKGWKVLLDAAAFAPSNRLDLSRWHPDFVDISFYKMFGYPTGIGCLLVRKTAAMKLRRPWYAGGTVSFSSVLANAHFLTPGPAGFEDGTANYLCMPAVEFGLKFIHRSISSTPTVKCSTVTTWKGWRTRNTFPCAQDVTAIRVHGRLHLALRRMSWPPASATGIP
jgi:selenocysteine lyase/cysteine desulfurase